MQHSKSEGFSLKRKITASLLALTIVGTSASPVLSSVVANAATGDDDTVAASGRLPNSGGSGIFWANATYFDYLSDQELSSGKWRDNIQAGTGFKGSEDNWYPFYQFNRKISSIASSNSDWSKPLYFGNMLPKDLDSNPYYVTDRYPHGLDAHGGPFDTAVGDEKLVRFDKHANNSNTIGGDHKSVQGLVKNQLKDGKLMVTDSLAAPYFDPSQLSGSAKIIDASFPFRIVKENDKVTRYVFDSTGGQDNVNFDYSNNEPTKINYAEGSGNAVRDGLRYFMTDTHSGYGIFPFNEKDKTESYSDATTYKYLYATTGGSGWQNIKVYFPGKTQTAWPGDQMQWCYDDADGTKVFRIQIPEGATKFVLNNGDNNAGGLNQTVDGTYDQLKTGMVYVNPEYNDKGENLTVDGKRTMGTFQGKYNAGIESYRKSGQSLDYGFGIRVDARFRVPKDGLLDPNGDKDDVNNHVQFNFSGDDDLWMFVTNDRTGESKLLLDMGGDHKMSTGNVDFATCVGHVDSVYSGANIGDINFKDWFNYSDTYTMSVFYMERGLLESNCQMSFTMTPLGNNVIVTEKIETTNINDGLKDDVKAISEFEFVAEDNDNHTETFSLGDGGKTEYPGTFTVGKNVKVTQKAKTAGLVYDTTFDYTDNTPDDHPKGNIEKGSGTSESDVSTKDAKFINVSGDPYDFAELQADFVNTPQISNVSITKIVTDFTGNQVPKNSSFDGDFDATISIDLGNGYKTYDNLVTSQGTGSDVKLRNGEDVTIEGVPVGAKVKVVETGVDGTKYQIEEIVTPDGAEVVKGDNNLQVVNPRVDPEGETALSITKNFFFESYPTMPSGDSATGIQLTANEFKFDLTTDVERSNIKQSGVNAKGNTEDGDVFFDKIKFAIDREQIDIPENTVLISPEEAAVADGVTLQFNIKEQDVTEKGVEKVNGDLTVYVNVKYNADTNTLDAEIDQSSSEFVATNELKSGSVTFSKTVLDEDGNVDEDNTDKFTATVTVSYNGGKTFLDVPFYYEDANGETHPLESDGSGSFQWKDFGHSDYMTIYNLPYGTQVRFAEEAKTGYIAPAPVTLIVGEQADGSINMYPRKNIVNQVKPANSTVITVNKEFTDAAKKANLSNEATFRFTLEPQGNAPAPVDGILVAALPTGASDVSFDKIKFDPTAADYSGDGQTYTYKVKEVDSGVANVIYDDREFTVTVKVKENAATGDLEVTQTYAVGGASANKITFTNDYETGKVTVKKVLKDFDDTTLDKDATFTVHAVIGYPNGSAEEKDIELKANGEAKDVITDAPIGTVVVITEPDSQQLDCTIDKETAEITANDTAPEVTVTNTRIDTVSASTVIKASKILQGATLAENDFRFSLTGNGNDVNLKAQNDAKGNVTFAPIEFGFRKFRSGTPFILLNKNDFKNTNTKDYTFTVKEIPSDRSDIDFDSNEYTVKVTVTVDDQLSKLSVSVPEEVSVETSFVNVKRGSATVTKLVKQMVDGEEKDFSTDTKFDIDVTIKEPQKDAKTETITLGKDETKTYTDLPVGTTITIVENDTKGFDVTYHPAAATVTLNAADNTVATAAVVAKNMRPTPGQTQAAPAVVKNLKGDTLTDGQFRFNIKGDGFAADGVNVENEGANVTFPAITYQYTEGEEHIDTDKHIVYVKNFDNNNQRVFTYAITEDSTFNHDSKTQYDGKTITATVTVTKRGTDTVTLSNTVAYDNNATFENVKLSDVSISKKVQRTNDAGQVVDIKTTDDDYNKLANQEFTVKTYVKYPGKDYESLPLTTSKGQMTEVDDGVYGFTIKHKEKVTISDLPVGTKVKFEETEDSNYKTDSKEITVGKDASDKVSTLTNILQAPGKGYASVNKAFTPNAILAGLNKTTDNTYNFNLAYTGNITTFRYDENVSINGAEKNWSANFPAITFPADLDYSNGIDFTFLMKETAATTADSNIVVDTDTFTLTYTLTQENGALKVTGPEIMKNGTEKAESATFYNGYLLGDVQVSKEFKDYDGSEMTAAVVKDLTFPVNINVTYPNKETETFKGEIGYNKFAVVKDLPRGTKVTVTETDTKGMTLKGIVPADPVTIGEEVQVVTVTNQRTKLVDTEVTIGARKFLEGSDITNNAPFSFSLTGEYKGQKINLTAKNDGNVVTFAPIKYTLDESKKGAENTIYLAKTDFENDKVKMQFTVTEVPDNRVNVKFDSNLTRTVNVEITRTETETEVKLSGGAVDAMAPEFTNTKLGKVGFTKTVTDYDGQSSNPDIDFIFKAEKKVGNDWTSINDNIVINLSKGEDTYSTDYLPVGTEVRFTETDNKGFIAEDPKVVTVKDQDLTKFTTFSNIHPEAQGAEVTVTAKKILEGATLKDGEFRFSLTGTVFGTEINQEKTNAEGGSIKFDAIKFSLEKEEEGAIKLTKAMFANSKTLNFELTVTEINPNRADIQLPAATAQTVKGTVTLTEDGSDAHLTAALTENANPEFTNIQLGRVGFTKIAKDINGAAFKPDADFIFKAEKKVGDNWDVINNNIVINLSKGVDSYVTEYLPVGTEVKFTETDDAGFENSVKEQTVTVALEDASKTVPYATVSFTNNRPVPGTVKATLTAEKVLNGAKLGDGDFSFFISGEGADANTEYKNEGKNITFDEITYKYSKNDSDKTSGSTVVLHDSDFTNGKAVREYTITEKNTELPDVIYAANTVKGVVTITKTETASNITLTADVTYPDGKTFTNEIKKGSVKIVKTNQAGEKVDDVTFKLFKVTGNDLDRETVLNSTLVDKKTTENGEAEFEKLDLYVDEYQNINNPTYQWYCLAETDPGKDYNLNSGLTFFQVPTANVYDLTFEYMNGKVITPTSGGTGMGMFTTVGCGLLGFGGLAFAGYMLFVRKSNKKRAQYRAK